MATESDADQFRDTLRGPHVLTVVGEDATNVSFRCERCANQINFNKPGIGSPSPVLVDGQWLPPADPEQWMGECNV